MTKINYNFAFLIALTIILSATNINISSVYYTVIIFTFIIVFIKFVLPYKFKLNVFTFLFIISAGLSILFNDINPLLKVHERFLIFILIVSIFGPLFSTKKIVVFRFFLFENFKLLIVSFVFLSFVLQLYGIGLSNEFKFTGLANHTMIMGPLSSLSILICIDKYTNSSTKKTKLIFILLFFLSIFSAILSASRSALIAVLISLILYFILKSSNLFSTIKKMVLFFIAIVFIINLNPYGVLDNLNTKIEHRESIDNITSGRDRMWQDRIDDFKMSPIIGVGYSNYVNIDNSKIDFATGESESGSGWIFLLSSLGLLGFTFYIIPIVNILIKTNRNSPVSFYFLLFFVIHSFAEGYMLAIGHLFAILMWLSISSSHDHFKNNNLYGYKKA